VDQGDLGTKRGRWTFGELPWPSWWKKTQWQSGDLGAAFSACLEQELSDRAGFYWLAVAFGAGALVYFVLPREPLLITLLVATPTAATAAMFAYAHGTRWRLLMVLTLCLAGAASAKLRVERVDAPFFEREQYAELTGRIIRAESRAEARPRITLDHLVSEQIAPAEMPRRVRLTHAASYGAPPLGARIAVTARLMPVAGPVVPGGYDPRRSAYFEGIGASGFLLGKWHIVEESPGFSPDLAIQRVRAAIVARIMAAQPGEAGAVAAALLVGERSALSTKTNESLRVSGLAHILSISGLHMMLVAGTTFFGVRALLALSPRLALGSPIRKWAAVAAVIVVSLYLTLSGGGAATLRAYVMAIIMFAAILLDRPAISMRNLAIAAFVVLAVEPEGVTEPGFQMSFAAAMALIAAWEVWRDRRNRNLTDDSVLPGYRLLRLGAGAMIGIAVTTLVAGFATAPFAAYHFERVASYSLIGNLVAGPLVSVIIMPFGLLTLLAMPFGLEALPLSIMARGIDALLAISDWVAALPSADLGAPRMAPLSLLFIVAGMLWFCLWRLRWRLFGLPLMAAGILLVPVLGNPPDILVAPEGMTLAVRDASGVLRVSGSRPGSYVIDQLFDEEGGPPPSEALREGVRCDEAACILHGAQRLSVSHVRSGSAFAEDCWRAEIVVTPLTAPKDCRAAIVIDADDLATHGAYALRIGSAASERSFLIRTSRPDVPRPWEAEVP
jgi:competence protein ComEC